ncbi:putative Gnk2-like domain-containing protein [Helianthus debilis subsp. tardiflorus]
MNDKYLVVQPACGNKRATTKDFIPSFVNTMEIISTNIKKSNFGTTVEGTGSSLVYGLAQCYGDIPTSDCLVCYARGRTAIPSCFPHTGGRVYLNDCFLRYENYSFFEEYIGQEDRRQDESVLNGN